ncbi:MAG: hypothetical protein KGL38_07975 [Gemmatimonadota bacterium]|nr:hypothetical protein [Gemmatimonadota bacterium]MDE3127928.1 hypothetical protein [Gemmatimonadota bacterium]MDE3216827.1 hypothetical protein [Gemmatimonadota bacterium]
MPFRTLTANGKTWRVMPSGRVTQYDHDEFALLFVAGTGHDREVRVTRYSPQGVRSRELALARMSEADLQHLFATSQPSFTSPEADYSA